MVKIYIGNPYKIFEDGDAICATTNGKTNKNGKATMGRGTAEFVRDTFGVDVLLGQYLKKYGNRAFYLGEYIFPEKEELKEFKNSWGKKLVLATFPTKEDYRDKSDLNLIEESSKQIVKIADKFKLQRIYIPIPGCGYGGLKWSKVKEKVNHLDERFIIYSLEESDFDD